MYMNVYIFLISPDLFTFSKYILHIALGGIKGEYIRLNEFEVQSIFEKSLTESCVRV